MKMRRKNEKRNIAKLLLYLAIFFFIIWLITTLWMIVIYKPINENGNGEDYNTDTLMTKDIESKINKPKIDTSSETIIEEPKIAKTSDLVDGEELEPTMENLLKERELRLKNIDAIFENMKSPKEISAIHSTFGKEVVYIYHTHSRESFLPYLKDTVKPEEAYHSSANITLVGKMLGRALEQRGVGTKVDTTDIVQVLDSKKLDYTSAYNVSREFVQAAHSDNRKLEYFLDVHRDSLRKENTTTEINGIKFANILFVVGTGHRNFEKNLTFAKDLHSLLGTRYPTLSKGVIQKDSDQGNGVYNQDISPNSIIIELGGVDNTVEELHRSTEALADVLSNYYFHN